MKIKTLTRNAALVAASLPAGIPATAVTVANAGGLPAMHEHRRVVFKWKP